MASSRFIVLDSYLFWQNRLLIIWCALNDQQKYHQNQQISVLIVHIFVLESEVANRVSWKSLALHCVLSEPWNTLFPYGKMLHVLGVAFPAKMMDLPCKLTLSYLVSSVASGIHLQDDWMRLDVGFMNVGEKTNSCVWTINSWLICTRHRPNERIGRRLKQENEPGNKGLNSHSSGLFTHWLSEAYCF